MMPCTWQELGSSLLGQEVTGKQGEEARRLHVATDWSWKLQDELMLSFMQIQMEREVFVDVCTHMA